MKFGGTSVGSPDRIRTAADLIATSSKTRPVVVVLSAMSKITDLLIETLKGAEGGKQEDVERNLTALRDRHRKACDELLPAEARKAAYQRIDEIIAGFEKVARGMLMLGERPPRSVDDAVTTGEKLSVLLCTALLRSRGVTAEAIHGTELIVTDDQFGDAAPLLESTEEKSRTRLFPLLESGHVPIVTGFNGATHDGVPTTLGRGGSDFSASILASVLDAAALWIWTDVDGILSADPRVVSGTRILPEVTYNEAAELAYNGAKVLHPRTLAPLVEKQIPVWIKNSFRPEEPGTRIVSRIADGHGVRAITSLAKVALISIEAVSTSMSGAQLMARALEAAARANVEVLLLTRSSFRQKFCMLVRAEDLDSVMESLRTELGLELAHGYVHPIDVDHSVGLLAAVGEGMKGTPGLAGKVFTALSEQKINIIAIAQGSSELTIAIVVKQEALDAAVQALHHSCRLGHNAPAEALV
jgi:aspartate kinase